MALCSDLAALADSRFDRCALLRCGVIFYAINATTLILDDAPIGAGVVSAAIARQSRMNKVSDYLKHAADCRDLARRARSTDERDMILNMVNTWEELARARRRKLEKEGRPED